MTSEEFADIVSLGYEIRGVEFKGSQPRRSALFFAKVVRAVLGMANRRDGGRIIIGVDEVDKKLVLTGLPPADLATWNYDDVAAGLAPYADPAIEFDQEILVRDGKSFVILKIREFGTTPILCKKEYPDVLRPGACYVRSRRKPETTEVPTYDDMRELLDLAIEKGVRRFITQARSVGLSVSTDAPDPSDADRFRRQIETL